MTRYLFCAVLAVVWSGLAAAQGKALPKKGVQTIEFLQPDGSPPKHVEIFRTISETPSMGMGGDMMGGMGGMEDEMGGMMGMGGGGDMEGMGMDDGGMDMGMGGGLANMGPQPRIDFLGTTPLGGATAEKDGVVEGKLNLTKFQTYRSKDSLRHATAVLAMHRTGYCFIPPHSRVRSPVTLREPGSIRVEKPDLLDADRFRVLACWQNGFAWPSTNQEMSDQGWLDAPLCRDDNDWRFTPRFRIFNVGMLGEDLRVPPGEIRVAIVPHEIQGKPLEEVRSGDALFQHLLSRGPSRIVVVTGREKESVVVRITLPQNVTIKIPKSKESSLPMWDGAPETKYYLVPNSQPLPQKWRRPPSGPFDDGGMGMGMGMDMGGMGDPFGDSPSETKLESVRRWSALLNEKRRERSTTLRIREASSISETSVRFHLIHPGQYRFVRVEDDSLVTHYHVTGQSKNGTEYEMVPAPPSNGLPTPHALVIGRQAVSLGSGGGRSRGMVLPTTNPALSGGALPGGGGDGLAPGDLPGIEAMAGLAAGAPGAVALPNGPSTAGLPADPSEPFAPGIPDVAPNTVGPQPKLPPEKQLAAVRKMRSEVEAVIEKMTKHRERLLEFERRLSGESPRSRN